VAGAVKEGPLGFCADVGLVVMRQLMEAELTHRIGPKHAKLPGRVANWHGTTTGPVVLGGRLVPVERPRGRTVDGKELELDTWAVFSSEDLLTQLVAERMLAGVATRRHADVAEPVGAELEAKSRGTGRSSVTNLLADLVARGLSAEGGRLVVIDGTKALAAAVRRVFGDQALVQRCTLHYGERRIMWSLGPAVGIEAGPGARTA
jgi:hypothetical protein